MKDLITIIINVYNGEKYIRQCLECIINQTYKNLEILIINDGSTDNTLSICKEYKDKKIRIISTENKGLPLSRNIGLDNAKGKYLYFIDVDDSIEQDTIEYLYKLIKKYNANIATCGVATVYNNIIKKRKRNKEHIKILNNIDYLKKELLITNRDLAIWNKLIEKKTINNLRFEDRIIDDIAFTHKLAIKSKKIVYSNQIKYYYNKNTSSLTSTLKENLERNIAEYNGYVERYNYIKKIYPNLIENEIGMMQIITRIYLRKNKEIVKQLDDKELRDFFKKLFSFRIFKGDVSIKEKTKFILFRISPSLHNKCIYAYLKLVGKKYLINCK
ncbi:MAG: glycosyltransferase family 2 protein [Bacilli bacterium]